MEIDLKALEVVIKMASSRTIAPYHFATATSHTWHRAKAVLQHFESTKKTIVGDMTDKELNTLVCRVFKAGLSVKSVALAFKIPESEVHRIIREAL